MDQYREDSSGEGILFRQTYEGCYKDGQKHGEGFLKFSTPNCLQKYFGKFLYDNYHGDGVYSQVKQNENYTYEGTFYVNKFEGYARVVLENCTYFEGLLKQNRRFGPGVLTYTDGTQDVGLWHGLDLMRLAERILPEWVPKLSQTPAGKMKLMKFKYLVPVNEKENSDEQLVVYNRTIRNTKSLFFDQPYFDQKFFQKMDCYIEVPLTEREIQEQSDQIFEEEQFSEELEEELEEEPTVSHTRSEIASYAIEEILKNIKRLRKCTPKELDLIKLKCSILRTLVDVNLIHKPNLGNKPTKKVLVTDLIAWNNEKFCLDVLKHSFKHRYKEDVVNFSVPKLLIGDRNSFGKPGIYESACRAFLTYCSEGKLQNVKQTIMKFRLNPDVTDANGNCGVLYASARDQVLVIRALTNFGSKLDQVNDEGLSALNMCLLRYISLQNNVKNWEQAFLDPKISQEIQEQVEDWCPRASFVNLISHSYLSLIGYCDATYFQQHADLILHHIEDISKEHENLQWFFDKIGITPAGEDSLPQNFQNVYQHVEDAKQKYMFSTDLIKPKRKKAKIKNKSKKSDKKGAKKEEELRLRKLEDEKKLKVIFNTICVLLFQGADPNLIQIPVPTIVLGLYTQALELMEKLLESGADLFVTFTDDELGLLHLLCSMPATEKLEPMAAFLLSRGINANGRTGSEHWREERKKILGDYRGSYEDVGKTPLQILAARMDFEADPEGHLNNVAKVIARNSKTLRRQYLGHNALTLAILRGNIKLVETLLQAGANPNAKLGLSLGNPLTIYVLKRYAKPRMIPGVAECEHIMDILINYKANPLNPIEGQANALEFMMFDNYEPPRDIKGKMGKKGKKGKKPPKRAKKNKKNAQDEVKNYLKKLTKSVLHRHHQGKAVLMMLRLLTKGKLQDAKRLAQYLTVNDALRVLQLLVDGSILNLQDDVHVAMMNILLQFVEAYGFKAKGKDKKRKNRDQDTTGINIIKQLVPPDPEKTKEPKTPIIEAEVDPDEDKYIVCAQCGMKTNKNIVLCPECGLVHYCSHKCNQADRKNRLMHPCLGNFYNDELARLQDPHYKNPWRSMNMQNLLSIRPGKSLAALSPALGLLAKILTNPFSESGKDIDELTDITPSTAENMGDFLYELGLEDLINQVDRAVERARSARGTRSRLYQYGKRIMSGRSVKGEGKTGFKVDYMDQFGMDKGIKNRYKTDGKPTDEENGIYGKDRRQRDGKQLKGYDYDKDGKGPRHRNGKRTADDDNDKGTDNGAKKNGEKGDESGSRGKNGTKVSKEEDFDGKTSKNETDKDGEGDVYAKTQKAKRKEGSKKRNGKKGDEEGDESEIPRSGSKMRSGKDSEETDALAKGQRKRSKKRNGTDSDDAADISKTTKKGSKKRAGKKDEDEDSGNIDQRKKTSRKTRGQGDEDDYTGKDTNKRGGKYDKDTDFKGKGKESKKGWESDGASRDNQRGKDFGSKSAHFRGTSFKGKGDKSTTSGDLKEKYGRSKSSPHIGTQYEKSSNISGKSKIDPTTGRAYNLSSKDGQKRQYASVSSASNVPAQSSSKMRTFGAFGKSTNKMHNIDVNMVRQSYGRTFKTRDGCERKLPINNQIFVQVMQELFPEFDFSAVLAPFACLVDGDLYYRFTECKPIYFNTHL